MQLSGTSSSCSASVSSRKGLISDGRQDSGQGQEEAGVMSVGASPGPWDTLGRNQEGFRSFSMDTGDRGSPLRTGIWPPQWKAWPKVQMTRVLA